MKKNLVWHADPSHAWLEVTHKELMELGIDLKISSYSYRNGDMCYLEEDCDAGIYINALKKKHGEVEFTSNENHVNGASVIRTYARCGWGK
jgi:hypothetical protein